MQNDNKLRGILYNTPPGIILTSNYLRKNGVSPRLAWWYVHSHWLERLADKAYKRTNDKLSWSGLIYTLQTIDQLYIHVSGRTAIAISGKSHYLSLGKDSNIFVAVGKSEKIPAWFINSELTPEKFIIQKTVLQEDANVQKYLMTTKFNELEISYSCHELALLEILYNCKNEHDYEEASQLMESFPYLRSSVVQELLELSNSILATRLYLHLAKKCNHNWYKKLDLTKLKLGTGKRRVGDGKIYDKDLLLYVPVNQGY